MQQLLIQAEQADQTAVPDGMDLPEEIARREERLATLAQARAKIEVHAKSVMRGNWLNIRTNWHGGKKNQNKRQKTGWQTTHTACSRASRQRPDQPDR
ncbi:MAG: hypothetical protein HS120_01475 [Burkholderiales bacterium]|nr:hypothetical protein [Burkholderiales bacterium]